MQSNLGMHGDLSAKKIPAQKKAKARVLKVPFLGRAVMFTKDMGEALRPGEFTFLGHLEARHLSATGELLKVHDLGSGLVTNVGVMAMCNDFAWANNVQTLKLANFHATGTGVTAAAQTDIALQTAAAPTTVTAVTGTQTFTGAAMPNTTTSASTYKTVATVNYTSTLAITEWGLFSNATLSATTGTPATGTSATSLTATGTPYTASSTTVQGQQQFIVKTGTTASYGLIVNNTTSVLTIPLWVNTTTGALGTTPGATEAFTLLPVMWDHRVFAAINVNNGDSIQFTYTLTVNSGG